MVRTVMLSQWNLRIPCKVSEPEDGAVQRVVLGVHGLGGSAMDRIQTSLAEEMTLFYSAVVRFDFPAHGENPMDDRAFTVRNCVDTVISVGRWAREQYPEVTDLCIFATGFGAYITLLALEELLELPGQVKLVVQTPSVKMDETLLAMTAMTPDSLFALGRVSTRTQPPIEVPYSFYEDLRDNNVLTDYPIPMLILQGEKDEFIRMEDIQLFRQMNERSKLVTIPGASHRFLEGGAWDMVLDLTRDWFEFEQVLCCDWE